MRSLDALQKLTLFFLVAFFAVALTTGYWTVVRADDLNARNDNLRRLERERRVARGVMFARDGETVLVETTFDEEGLARRVYHVPALAPITGVWSLRYGSSGLEAAYDEWLAGRKGEPFTQLLDNLLHRPVRGYDLVLTVDPNVQAEAVRLLGNRRGAVVVTEVQTGDVLALVSLPTYDPNTFEEDAEALQQSPANPLLNRATQGLYTPGSVFKIVTLAGALAKGKTSLDERWQDPDGIFFVNGFPIRDFEEPPQDEFDTAHALAYSSNVVFAQLGLRLGPDAMREVARAFGFGETPPIVIEAEASRLGRDDFLLDDVGLASTAFGQGQVQMTPLHVNLITAAVANGGQLPRPRLVQAIRTADGETLQRIRPMTWKRAVSGRVAEQVREAMSVAARDGYARAGAPACTTIGGKTGTAQLGGTLAPHAWFTAFAPANEPRYAVTVIVENGGLGGDVAAPIARRLIEMLVCTP